MSQPLGHGVWSLSQGLFIHENIAIVELALIDFDYTCDCIVCLRVYVAAEADNGYVADVNIAVFTPLLACMSSRGILKSIPSEASAHFMESSMIR